MKIIINIGKGNEAMKSNRNVFAAIKRLNMKSMQGNIRDINGNTVGDFKVYEHVLNIHALEWFDNSAGNSYFQAVATLDGKNFLVSFQNGYGSHYIDVCLDRLRKAKLIPSQNYLNQGYAQYCDRNNILLTYSKSEDRKKKDVLQYGIDCQVLTYEGEIKNEK